MRLGSRRFAAVAPAGVDSGVRVLAASAVARSASLRGPSRPDPAFGRLRRPRRPAQRAGATTLQKATTSGATPLEKQRRSEATARAARRGVSGAEPLTVTDPMRPSRDFFSLSHGDPIAAALVSPTETLSPLL